MAPALGRHGHRSRLTDARDDLHPDAQYRTTRAITIDAPPEAVWPWLVQVGGGRAGFYSNDLLDNLGRSSATTVLPALQHLETGQWVPMSPSGVPTPQTAFKVHSFVTEEWLLWAKSDSTWAWRLTPSPAGGTRLVTRIHAVYNWRRPVTAIFGVMLMEFGDFAMLRSMLRGLKARAEAAHPSEHRIERMPVQRSSLTRNHAVPHGILLVGTKAPNRAGTAGV